MNTLELIKNKHSICFYGLGRENLSLIHYLADKKLISEIVYCDQKMFQDPLPLPSRFIESSAISAYNIVFKAPGVSLYQEQIQQALAKGAKVLSPNQIFFDQHQSFKICVTGSKGKSTFCKLLAELLETIGIKVLLAGNIGRPLMDQIDQVAQVAVIELSSYQLASLQIEPNVAVLTSIFPEHLSWHLTLSQYYQDKLRISQGAKQFIIFNQKTANFLNQERPDLEYQQINYLIKDHIIKLEENCELKINNPYFYPDHLQATLQGAVGILEHIASSFGLNWKNQIVAIQSVIDSFQGLPHRLEVFYDQDNLLAVDDSISTAPEAVIAALQAYSNYQISLFVGGYSKGTSQKLIIEYLNNHPEISVFCYSITGKTVFTELTVNNKFYTEKLIEATQLAWTKARLLKSTTKQLFLLSPGAASFDQFIDFEDRGNQFQEMIRNHFLN